ncbi:MAG: DUF1858 domain-containing protein [Nitrospinae bacterium]|nr:DUF1858 domain-containing protein [Nitrospinota bacterium]
MDKSAKLFIKASLYYIAAGVFLGAHLSFFEHAREQLRFVHVHVMLLGFMAMMIYGVAYHILPRFNARPVPYPSLIPVQFWMANIGLWGMAAFYILGAYWSEGPLRLFFGLFSAVEAGAILIFVVNILGVLKEEPEAQTVVTLEVPPAPQEPPAEPVKVAPSMKIAEILDKWPHLEEVFFAEGLHSVANPAVRGTVARMVTLEMAAKKAGRSLFELIAALEGKKLVSGSGAPAAPAHPEGFLPMGAQIKRGEMATLKTQIGNLLEVYPETKIIFEKNYGAACFTCPGQKTETVEQTAMMHNMPGETILGEINRVIKEAAG